MKVEIYGTQTCHYCKLAAELCKRNSIEYDYVDVGIEVNLKNLSERMGSRPRTVPQIYIDGEHIPSGYEGLKSKINA